MSVLDDFDSAPWNVVKELTIIPKDSSKKSRDVISIRGDWRLIQSRIYQRLLLRKCRPFRSSYGGVRGKSAIGNAKAHLGNSFALVTDISSFYPSISTSRVNKFFLDKHCSYEVARVLTRLCTYEHHLALGLTTSPIIANELFKPIDQQIANACRRMNLTYTRFVDDITISGKFDLRHCGIRSEVRKIIQRHYFDVSEDKTKTGRLDGEIIITGIQLKKNHLDAPAKYVQELHRAIDDHASLASNGPFNGPLLTEAEILGKSYFAIGLNPGRKRILLGAIKRIDWGAVSFYASERCLESCHELKVPRGINA